ncbi:MAG: DUF4157 domain-containing protein, partial [Bacteroidota bacterium]
MKQTSTRRSRRHRNPHSQDQQQEQQPFFTKHQANADNQNAFFQTKLTIGQPGDKYEQEADSMADAVVNGSNNAPAVQKKAKGIQKMDSSKMEEDRAIQEKSMIQRMEGGEEEEPVQMHSAEEEEAVQMMEEEEPIQKMESEEEEAVQVQTEDEEPVQMMEGEEEESVQMQKEEEEAVQTKSGTAKNTASPQLSQQIKNRSGSGKTMSEPVRAEMEQAFGTDFSGVKIHTDSTAVQMNKELGAQAFTHGKDVYFNSGKYHPESSQGKHLLAHELTHVVQQGKAKLKGGKCEKKSRIHPTATKNSIQTQESAISYRLSIGLGHPGRYERQTQVATNEDMLTAYQDLGTAMFFDETYFMPDRMSNALYDKWNDYESDVIYKMENWYSAFDPQTPIHIEDIRAFRNVQRGASKIANKAYRYYREQQRNHQRALANEQRKIVLAEQQIKKALRAKFLSGESADTDIGFLWAMSDHLFTLGGEISNLMELGYYTRMATAFVPAAISVANTAINWSRESPSTFGSGLEGLAALNNVISVGGLANSLVVNPAYIVTAYIGPMLNAVTAALGRLQQLLIERNDDAVEIIGNPLYAEAEPGGSALWNYMVETMNAQSPREIPMPSGSVYAYFDGFRNSFDEYARSQQLNSSNTDEYEEIPTQSSWVILSEINPSQFKGWLFDHRDTVWTLLYGSRNP